MTDIEKVARAIVEAMYQEALTDEQWAEVMADGAPLMWGDAAIAAPQEPVAWMYEIAGAISIDINTGERNYTNWEQRLSTHKPCVEGSGVRNVAPLYAFPTPPAGGSDDAI